MSRVVTRIAFAWMAALLSVVGVMTVLDEARSVQAKPLMASYVVGGVCGATIQACIDNATVVAGDTLIIPAATYTESLTLSKAVSLTGLSGFSTTTIIRAVTGQRVLTVTAVMTNAVVIANLTMENGNPTDSGGGILLGAGAEPLIRDVIIRNNIAGLRGGGISALGALTLYNVQITGNKASNGDGGGATADGNLTVSNSQIVGNSVITGGFGGGLDTNANLVMVNTTIESNDNATAGTACCFGSGGGTGSGGSTIITNVQYLRNRTSGYFGGGLYAVGGVTATNSLFSQNTTLDSVSGYGGGLLTFGALVISNSQFSSNVAMQGGGGAYANLTSTLNNAWFQNNQCVIDFCSGGGIYASSLPQLISNTTFIGNSSAGDGGGLSSPGTLSVANSQFTGNTAFRRGGGINAVITATVTNSTFLSNTAGISATAGTAGGGGLNANSGFLTLSGTQFISNVVLNGFGGAATMFGLGGRMVVTNALFTNNTAISYTFARGGALYGVAPLTITNSQFYSNTSVQEGGGVMNAVTTTVSGSWFENNQCTAACSGGGIRVLNISMPLTLNSTIFISNAATNGGGAAASGPTTISGGAFQRNTSRSGSLGGGGLTVFNNQPVNISGTQFLTNAAALAGGGVYVQGTTTLANALFRSNSGGNGGGGLFSSDSITLTSVQFISNTASGNNGGGAWTMGNAIVNSSYFTGNQLLAGNNSGGLDALGSMTVTNSVFFNNVAFNSGGGSGAGNVATLTNVRYISNTALNLYGGGIYAHNGARLDNVHVISNSASGANGYGGGLLVFTSSPSVLANSYFTSNTSTWNGGAVYASNLSVTNTQFVSNVAGAPGGAIQSFGTVTIERSTLQANRSGGNGGGFSGIANLSVTDTQFINNSTGGAGGGLAINGNFTATRSVFIGNMATDGGGFYTYNGDSTIVNTLFARNTATSTIGSAIVLASTGKASILHTTIATPTLNGSSAIAIFTGTIGVTNTIIANHAVAISNTANISNASASVYEDYNLFAGNGANLTGLIGSGGHSLVGDAAFVNAAADNYHIGPTSLAVDEAINAGVVNDSDGDARPLGSGFDIGYDESAYSAAADVQISKSVVPATGVPGTPVTYTIVFTNVGPQAAHGGVISDIMPAYLSNMTFTSNLSLTQIGSTDFNWLLPTLAPNSSGQITLSGIISPFVTIGVRFTNTVTISSTRPDNTTSNNSASIGFDIIQPEMAFAAAVYTTTENATNAVVTITLASAQATTVTVNYATSDLTAVSALPTPDYTAVNGTLVIPPGQTVATLTVPIINDALNEANETLRVTLSNPNGAMFASLQSSISATIVISDNDPLPSLAIADVIVTEGNSGTTSAFVNVALAAPSGQIVSVQYTTSDGSATSPGDYAPTSGTLTFVPNGPTLQTIVVSVSGDTQLEPTEALTITLSNPTNATISDNQATVTITNDDSQSLLNIYLPLIVR